MAKKQARQALTLQDGVVIDGAEAEGAEKGSDGSRRGSPKGRPWVGRLDQLADWKRQVARIYRLMRWREIEPAEGARLVYVLEAGARIARAELEQARLDEQQEQIKQLSAQLAALQSGVSMHPLPAPTPQELPAWAEDPQEPSLPAPGAA